MKTIYTAALLMALASSAFAEGSAVGTNDTAAIRSVFSEFFASWNKNDVNGMITHWTDDASLINPMGQSANGKSEVEKLLTQEQTTVFKGSTAKLVGLATKSISGDIAWFDGELSVDNAHGPNGAVMPQMKIHFAGLMQKKGGQWLIAENRPYAFIVPKRVKNHKEKKAG